MARAVGKSLAMRLIEARYGKPIVPILVSALNQYGSVAAAADALGIDTETLYTWMRRLGIELRKTPVVLAESN